VWACRRSIPGPVRGHELDGGWTASINETHRTGIRPRSLGQRIQRQQQQQQTTTYTAASAVWFRHPVVSVHVSPVALAASMECVAVALASLHPHAGTVGHHARQRHATTTAAVVVRGERRAGRKGSRQGSVGTERPDVRWMRSLVDRTGVGFYVVSGKLEEMHRAAVQHTRDGRVLRRESPNKASSLALGWRHRRWRFRG
jgi:hypothetical protein